MRVLMLGNSFTYYHNMPDILSEILGCTVVSQTRGGARLAEHLNPDTEMGAATLRLLAEEKWDYVVMQEQSSAPFTQPRAFAESAGELCRLARAAGATPIFYATWAYREDSEKLASTGMRFEEMDRALRVAYSAAARSGDALIADVGAAFKALRGILCLYEADDYHPSEAGSVLAASVIAHAIASHRQ